MELEPLRRVHRHELQRVRSGQRLVLACFQRGMGEKRGQFVGFVHTCGLARRLHVALRDESRGGIDQLREVFQAIGALPLGPVVRLQPARLDHVLDDLGQVQAVRRLAHLLDYCDKGRNPFEG
ncbi:hypothetical protein D3C83_39200 [compost metagenome]